MQNAPKPASTPAGPVIDLSEIRRTLFGRWKVLAVFGAVGFFWALISLHGTPDRYSVQMVVTPVTSTENSSTTRLNSLASLAGVNLHGMDSMTQFQLYLEGLRSREVADALAKDTDYMHRLFAYEWNGKTKSWQEPPRGIVDTAIRGVRSLLGFPNTAWHPPDGENVQGYLNRSLTISQDPREPFIATVSLESSNIPLAMTTLYKINRLADAHLRQQALMRTGKYIAYLTNQLQTVTLAEQREAITTTLSDQEKYAMMANAGDSFAAEMFDKPSTSNFPVAPRPTPTYLLWILVWGLIGAICVLADRYFPAPLERVRAGIRRRVKTEKLPRFVQRALQP